MCALESMTKVCVVVVVAANEDICLEVMPLKARVPSAATCAVVIAAICVVERLFTPSDPIPAIAEVESKARALVASVASWVVDRAATCALESPGACFVVKFVICEAVKLAT